MKKIRLKNTSTQGHPLEATFLPEGGMNLCSYRLGEIEVIDQETLPLFEERRAGLGALIGPHFHQREQVSGGMRPSFLILLREKPKGAKTPSLMELPAMFLGNLLLQILKSKDVFMEVTYIETFP